MSWFRKKKAPAGDVSLRRDSRAPAIARHGSVVASGHLYKQGREFASWTFRRYDLHDNSTLVYYDGDKVKGELDLSEVTITHGADAMNRVVQAKGSASTGSEMALDLHAPHGDESKARPSLLSRFGGGSTSSSKSNERGSKHGQSMGRTLRVILDSPQDAALLCSALAALDPQADGNAQDFAAVQGWMMPRRNMTDLQEQVQSARYL